MNLDTLRQALEKTLADIESKTVKDGNDLLALMLGQSYANEASASDSQPGDGLNIIQKILFGRSAQATAQASYNQWYRVAEYADLIRRDPSKAVEYAAAINGMADSVRSEIIAFSREFLGYVPTFEPSSRPE